jgi:hypothetical protein
MGEQNALLHGKTLFVVSTGDAENVALPFVAKSVAWDFLGDLLVVEDTAGSEMNPWLDTGMLRVEITLSVQSLLIVKVDEFLSPSCGV